VAGGGAADAVLAGVVDEREQAAMAPATATMAAARSQTSRDIEITPQVRGP